MWIYSCDFNLGLVDLLLLLHNFKTAHKHTELGFFCCFMCFVMILILTFVLSLEFFSFGVHSLTHSIGFVMKKFLRFVCLLCLFVSVCIFFALFLNKCGRAKGINCFFLSLSFSFSLVQLHNFKIAQFHLHRNFALRSKFVC